MHKRVWNDIGVCAAEPTISFGDWNRVEFQWNVVISNRRHSFSLAYNRPPTMHFSVGSSIFIQANNSLTPKYCLYKSHHASIFCRCGFAWCCNWIYDLFISLYIHNTVSACRRLIQGKIHAFDRSLIKIFDTK